MSHTINSHPTVTLSVRISPKIRDQLESLADSTCRTKSFLAAEALECYVAAQTWQTKAIEKSLKKANGKKANFVSHAKVVDWLKNWDTKAEQDLPK